MGFCNIYNLSFDKFIKDEDYNFLLGIFKFNFDDLVLYVMLMRNI